MHEDVTNVPQPGIQYLRSKMYQGACKKDKEGGTEGL